LISNQVNIWREIQEDGVGLVEYDDQSGTENLLRRWIVLPPEKCDDMRRKAVATFNTRFEIHQVARSMVEAISTTMKVPIQHNIPA
jgi:hypothetical protein